jgi:hypothetical protein
MTPEELYYKAIRFRGQGREKLLSAVLRTYPNLPAQVRWGNDPVSWAENKAMMDLWSFQRKALNAIWNHKRVAMVGCHRFGKSVVLGIAGCCWIDTNHPGDALVLTTAHSSGQVKQAVWTSMNKIHAQAKLAGRMNQTEWWYPYRASSGKTTEIRVGMGRKPQQKDAAAFQGSYARKVLALADEAQRLDDTFIGALETTVSNDESKIVLAGNPDDEKTPFYRICQPGSGWHVIWVNAFETPNFTNEQVPYELKRLLISRQWVEDTKNTWGEDSAYYGSKVLAKFPESTNTSIYKLTWIDDMLARILPAALPVTIGIDIGAGGDKTTIVSNYGGKCKLEFSQKIKNTMDSLEVAMNFLTEHPEVRYAFIDEIGIGLGTVDRAQQIAEDLLESKETRKTADKIVGIHVGKGASDPDHFINLRAELHWYVRTRLENGTISCPDQIIGSQMLSARLKRSAGRIGVVPKEEYHKSPDEFEALLLSFAGEVVDVDEIKKEKGKNRNQIVTR